jgi:alpha-glucosidase (family GH31 glycosyl hydrolase)
MTKASYDWFVKNSTKRPFIVERSSFAGLGKYAGKWLGDSNSTYEDMQRTVSGVMMMGVFGIPFAGGDICGFAGQNSDAHLCARWHQVGAFQPFSRNHRDCNGRQQEPYQFLNEKVGNTNVTVTDVMRDAILKKYSLHRYYYTHMFHMSRNPQYSTFYKPLFFEFPNDPAAYQAILSENVMLGPSLKLSIKTSPLKDVITDTNTYYFPEGNWCDIFDRNTSCIIQPINKTGGSIQMLPAGLQDFQVHLRSGHIVVMQDAYKIMPNTSEDMKKAPVDLHIHPQKITETQRNRNYQAKGVYVNDDGKNPTIDGNYNEYQISFTYRDQINSTIRDENIYITVGLVNNASNYYSNETKCSAVDQNDYLGSIYINAEEGEFQSA